jgi:hypothetical protein
MASLKESHCNWAPMFEEIFDVFHNRELTPEEAFERHFHARRGETSYFNFTRDNVWRLGPVSEGLIELNKKRFTQRDAFSYRDAPQSTVLAFNPRSKKDCAKMPPVLVECVAVELNRVETMLGPITSAYAQFFQRPLDADPEQIIGGVRHADEPLRSGHEAGHMNLFMHAIDPSIPPHLACAWGMQVACMTDMRRSEYRRECLWIDPDNNDHWRWYEPEVQERIAKLVEKHGGARQLQPNYKHALRDKRLHWAGLAQPEVLEQLTPEQRDGYFLTGNIDIRFMPYQRMLDRELDPKSRFARGTAPA